MGKILENVFLIPKFFRIKVHKVLWVSLWRKNDEGEVAFVWKGKTLWEYTTSDGYWLSYRWDAIQKLAWLNISTGSCIIQSGDLGYNCLALLRKI